MDQMQRMESLGRRHGRRILVLIGACIFLCAAAEGGCAEGRPSQERNFDDQTNAATFPIRMYQKFISGVNGHECPMMPSCSQYAVEAFEKHGYLLGWIMTSDRLLRCGRDETRLSQTRRKNNETYSYDPVENNDFWWHDR
jgi:putative membrane protein insertion efficiency factor